jgi:hypothetical protein
MPPSSKYKKGRLANLKGRVKRAIEDVGELAERLRSPLKKRQKKDQSEKEMAQPAQYAFNSLSKLCIDNI